jgi:arylsulfatase
MVVEMLRRLFAIGCIFISVAICISVAIDSPVMAEEKKPNILVIWGDDIGTWNISHNSRGMMGYSTPNIDRIAKEGVAFTDYYGQQSCTAGRAAFIGGNVPVRTGMTKVGLPGAKEGWQKTDVTMATVLKSLGYATGQFGKNHQGDRDEHLPTMHGFDEFMGNLYHLNAEEEPENEDYPKNPEFRKKFGPRGVIKAFSASTRRVSHGSPGGTAPGCTSARTSSRSIAASPARMSIRMAWSSTTCTSVNCSSSSMN